MDILSRLGIEEPDTHPEEDMELPCVDVATTSSEQLSSLLQKSLASSCNYVGIKLGAAAALLCMSRGPLYSEGVRYTYIGIIKIGVQKSCRGQGHMVRLIRAVHASCRLLARELIVTEVASERLRSVLKAHPESWKPVRWMERGEPDAFLYLRNQPPCL